MAEQAAWHFVRDQAPEMALTAINPTMVLGPPLHVHFGGSVEVVQRALRAKDPMVPNFGLAIVDARDIAEMYVLALCTPQSYGKRILGVSSFLWLVEIGQLLKKQYPDRKIVTRLAPNFFIRLMGVFDAAIRGIVPNLGKRFDASNERAKELFGMDFISAEESLIATTQFLIDHDRVN